MKLVQRYLYPLFITIFFCLLYGLSTTAVPTGYADADEIVSISYFGGVAHPPGYPLLTAISHLYLSIISPQNVALATNILSGFIQITGLLILFYLSQNILKNIFQKEKGISLPTSIAITSILGTSYLYWLYATTLEVISLTSLFTLTTIASAYRWSIQLNSKWFLYTCVSFGLLISHYQLGIVLAPGLLLLLLCQIKKFRSQQSHAITTIIGGLVLTVITFFIINSLLFIQNRPQTLSWSFDQTVSGWIDHIFRKDYQGFDLQTNTSFQNSYTTNPKIDNFTLTSFLQYVTLLWQHFGFINCLAAIIGTIIIWKKQKLLAAVITTWFLVSGPILAMYMRSTSITFNPQHALGVSQRHFIISEIVFVLFIMFGVAAAFRWIESLAFSSKYKLTIVFLIFIILTSVSNNLSLLTNKEGRQLASTVALTRLHQAKSNSLIICTNDIDCYTLFYYHFVEKIRPDISVVCYMPVYTVSWLKQHPEYYPYPEFDNPDYLPQLIAWNVPKRTVYLTNGLNFYTDYIGLESGPFYLTPSNFLLEIGILPNPIIPDQMPSIDFPSIKDIDRKDAYGQGIIETISTNQAYVGYLAIRYGQLQTATNFLTQALNLDPQNYQAVELSNGLNTFSKELLITEEVSSASKYLQLASQQEKAGNIPEADKYYRHASYLSPTDDSVLDNLSSFYSRHNYPHLSAIIEGHRLLFEK